MDPRLLLTTLLIPAAALAAEQQPLQPQEQPQAQQEQPAGQQEQGRGEQEQPRAQAQQPDPYTERNKRVQEALRQRGLYNGPVNGEIGPNTQAAIAQFQLSMPMPADGMLDDSTLAALGVELPEVASAGGSIQPQPASVEAGTPDRPLGGSCDALIGPEKDRCLQRGGTVEASTNASTGETAPATPKGK